MLFKPETKFSLVRVILGLAAWSVTLGATAPSTSKQPEANTAGSAKSSTARAENWVSVGAHPAGGDLSYDSLSIRPLEGPQMEIVMRMRNSERLSESGLTEMFQRMSVDCLEGYTKTSKRVGRMKDGNLYVIPTPDSFPEQPLHDAMWRVAAAACGSHIAAASKKLIGRPALVAAFNRYIASNQMYMSVRGSSDQLRSFRLTPSNCDIFVVGESQEFKLPVRLSAKVDVAYSTRSGNLTSKSTVTLPSEVVVYADNVSVAEAIKSHVEAIAEAGRACLPLYRVGAVRG